MAHANPTQIQQYLKGVDYPATREQLIDNAKSLGTEETVCASLEQLPDEDCQTSAEVSQAFKEMSGDAVRTEQEGQGATEDRREGQDASVQELGTNEFLIQVIEDALAEMELCMLALDRSERDDVKSFAQSMLDEHGKLGQQIEKMAQSMELTFPKKMRREHASMLREMSRLKGEKFDQRFIDENVRYHENDLKVFTHYAGQQGEAAVQKLAQAGAKLFEKHLKMAKQLQAGG